MLVVTLVMLMLIAALALTLGTSAQAQAQVATHTRELSESAVVADTGLARGKARLVWEFAHNWSGQDPELKSMTAGQEHLAWLTTPEGAVVDVACQRVDAEYMDFLLTSRADGRAPRELEMVVRIRYVLSSSPRLRGRGAGAIVGFGPVAITGNFVVDGRDHPADDPYTIIPGGGAPSIVSTQRVRLESGSVLVSGTTQDGVDHAPVGRDKAEDGVQFDANTEIWNPETDDAATDGVDNDFDGQIDEATGAANTADEYFDLAHGDLKAMAMASGTYFTDLASYNRYVKREGNSRNGVDDDGDGVVDDDGSSAAGKVIYLEVPNGSTVGGGEGELGAVELPVNPAPDHVPAIVVIAGQDPTKHDIDVGPVHCNNGIFQGVLLSERIVNMNGNGGIMGQVVTFTRNGATSVGSGTFDVWYSTEVLDRLPRRDGSTGGDEPTAVEPVVLMWREAVAR